jgi:hypothetical protein
MFVNLSSSFIDFCQGKHLTCFYPQIGLKALQLNRRLNPLVHQRLCTGVDCVADPIWDRLLK